MKGVRINEVEYPLENGEMAKLAVLIYTGDDDPCEILDTVVSRYTEGCDKYYELIDAYMCMPWVRVVMSNINNMKQESFKDYMLRENRDRKIAMVMDKN